MVRKTQPLQQRWTLNTAAAIVLVLSGCSRPDATPAPPASPDSPDPAAAASSSGENTPAAALPTDAAILETVQDRAEELNICDGFWNPEVVQSYSRVYAVEGQTLVEVVCDILAYNAVFAYLTYEPDGTLRPLSFDGFYSDETGEMVRTSETTLVGAGPNSFDPDKQRLNVFYKGRGLGDCGSIADYRWTGSGFTLETFRYRECADTSASDLEFPIVFP